jgi:hypothetical protein
VSGFFGLMGKASILLRWRRAAMIMPVVVLPLPIWQLKIKAASRGTPHKRL